MASSVISVVISLPRIAPRIAATFWPLGDGNRVLRGNMDWRTGDAVIDIVIKDRAVFIK